MWINKWHRIKCGDVALTHFSPVSHFYTSWKRQKTIVLQKKEAARVNVYRWKEKLQQPNCSIMYLQQPLSNQHLVHLHLRPSKFSAKVFIKLKDYFHSALGIKFILRMNLESKAGRRKKEINETRQINEI